MNAAQVPQIFNRAHASAKWARARSRQSREGSAAYLYDSIAEDIAERLDFIRFEPSSALVVGDMTGALEA